MPHSGFPKYITKENISPNIEDISHILPNVSQTHYVIIEGRTYVESHVKNVTPLISSPPESPLEVTSGALALSSHTTTLFIQVRISDVQI